MTSPHLPEPDDHLDPALGALAAAILDGADIDWTTTSDSDSIAAFAGELRLVADIASLHRSLSDDEAEVSQFPPTFPWPVGKLMLTQSLGRGVYGEVFRAWDNELHRDVAVKLLFGGRQRGDAAARGLDEGRLLARVRHPNVVAVYAAERIDGRVGLVTEYIKGQTLAQIVRESGPFSAEQVVRAGLDLCRALEAVHTAGLLHRDIKAQNVMRDSGGRVVLMDFGAGLAGEAAPALAGTPLYLAPEVLDGAAATGQSDVYSLGVLLHYLLTGGFPVSGTSMAEIREAHRAGARAQLRSRADVPRALAAAVDAATDPVPSRRLPTAAAFANALRDASTPRRRHLHLALGAAGVAVALVSGTVLWRTVKPVPIPAAHTASAAVSRLTVPPYSTFGGPSFDGRYLVHLDPKQQAWLTQIETGHVRRILEGETGQLQWIIISPDGTRIAYTAIHPDARVELRIAMLDDRWPASVQGPQRTFRLMTAVEPTYIAPVGWSRDGTRLAMLTHRKEGPADLSVAAFDGSDQRVLHSFTHGRPRRVSFSGDGRYLVYDQPNWPSPQRDIHIIPVDGSAAPAPLIADASNDELPVWSADGEGLIFSSDRNGSSGLWRVPIRNGAVAGSPEVIATGMQAVTPIAVTASGDYYYALQTKHEELFTVPLDKRGVASGPPVPVPGKVGLGRTSPAWSRDGRTLAHQTTRGMNLYDFGNFLTLRDAAGNVLQDIGLPLIYFQGGVVRWAPDGRSMLVRGKGLDGHFGFHQLDPRTGQTSALVRAQPQGEEQNLGAHPGWGPDGRTIVWSRFGVGLLERTLATGEERVILAIGRDEVISAASPSNGGGVVAFSKTVSPRSHPISILALLGEDGSITELVRQPGSRSILFAEWAPDDAAVIYAEVMENGTWRLRRVPVSGGEPIDMNVTIDPIRIRISHRPDGRALTYASGTSAFEIWVMRGIAR